MKGSKKTASGWKSDAFVLFLDGARTNERERERERQTGLNAYNFITQLLVITS